MMLVEQTTIASGVLPVQAFKDHLRLGTGFADDDVQDGVLEAHLRAAIAAIEARTSKAILARGFQWSVGAWRDLSAQVLPIAPVSAVTSLTIVDRLGVTEAIDPARYTLIPDTHRPRIVSTGFCLPQIPVNGRAEMVFEAGFASGWEDVPPDLAHAVFLLAAQYYEARAMPGSSKLPDSVAALTETYRDLRLFGGGRA
ncbi:hypothetical protein GQE99_13575 [Maritimibacter sp. DP07]|uniref:Phage gp6-like head-tail connector protein n=1 Tax=Maritimibacter harenae TaxID=2606218 RepID=A0A845M870_9RHOB|nr:hypothetical protein [Maritimibacter harenae]MZR14047.1 hypothetical protein [Maritimibacter harenae]